MEIKKTVKRIAAVGAGAAMLGATAMGALAAVDLKDYPSMFVTEGSFNGYIVVGENAKSVDNLAAIDISSSMETVAVEAGSEVATVEGDAWQVGTSSKVLELANSNASDSSINGETFRNINTFIGSDELEALQDGTWETNNDRYDYQQFVFFDSTATTSSIVKYTQDDADVDADNLFIASSDPFARYKLEFSSTAQSDVTDSTGSADTTGTYLDDFENTKLTMFGKEYTVVQARKPAGTNLNAVQLVLMAGASSDTLLEGESKTYDAAGKKYDVTSSYVDDTYAKFTVNGEATNKLKVGETYILSDGSELGVSEVLYQSYAGGIHSATFYIGAQKMELRDDNIAAVTGSYNLKIGSDDIDGTQVKITGTDNNVTASISTIEINMTAQSDYFVGAGHKLSEAMEATGDKADMLAGQAFDYEYKGLTKETTHELDLKTSSSRRYHLTLFDGDDNAVDLPIAYAEGTYNLSVGDDTHANTRQNQKRLVLNETVAIQKDDYFVITDGTAASGSAKSYLLQYKGSDAVSQTSPKIRFKNIGSGETLEYAVSTSTTVATIKLGGYSFDVGNSSSTIADNFNVNVSLNGDTDSSDAALVNFIDSYGSQWAFEASVNETGTGYNSYDGTPTGTGTTNVSMQTYVLVTQTTPNVDDYDNMVPSTIVMNITAVSGPEVDASVTGVTLLTPDGSSDVSYGYTSIGAFLTLTNPSSDPSELKMVYPKVQLVPQVFVTSGAVTSGAKKSGKMTRVNVVEASRLDSEISDVKAQNLIVVGGPCVNSVAASLLGNPADCTEGFTPGKARVKLFEQANGKVAMLVAGYSGEDTRLAGKIVAQQAEKLLGSEVEIEGTSLKDVQVGAPSPAGTQ